MTDQPSVSDHRARGGVRWLRRVGRGYLEVEPEPAITARHHFGATLRRCRWLLGAVIAAQLADVVTTRIALASPAYHERNPVMSQLTIHGVGGSAVGAAVKLGVVLGVLAIAMARLTPERAQVAVALALVLSLAAPVVNTLVLLRG